MDTHATPGILSAPDSCRQRRLGWSAGFAVPCLVLVTVAVGGWLRPLPTGSAAGIILALMLATAAISDVQTRRIPNWATYPGLFWALLLNFAVSVSVREFGLTTNLWSMASPSLIGPSHFGAIGIGPSLVGAAGCFLAMAIGTRGWSSAGGDVKLATAIGAFLGLRLGILALCIGYILAGVLAAAVCVWKFGATRLIRTSATWIGHLLFPVSIAAPDFDVRAAHAITIPLGGSFALGVVSALFLLPGLRN